MLKIVAAGAFAAFVISGPLQHVGAVPQTVVGDLSKQSLKMVLGQLVGDAHAKRCGPGGGFKMKNNNGWGNGPESGPAPGKSGSNNAPNAGQKRDNLGR